MKKQILLLAASFFSIPSFCCLGLMPVSAWAAGDLVSVKVVEKSVAEVLQEIATQVGYKLEISEDISDPVSIYLRDQPLATAVDRILKGYNYSLLSNDDQKVLKILIVSGKENVVSKDDLPLKNTGDNSSGDGFDDGVAKAMAEYQGGEAKPVTEPQESTMSGVDVAVSAYQQQGGEPLDPSLETTVRSSMSGATDALETYSQGSFQGNEAETVPSSMSKVAEVMSAYSAGVGKSSSTPVTQSSMSGVTDALKEYSAGK